MSADYLDTEEALRQLNFYFDVEAMRGSILYGERANRWEEDCSVAFRRLWHLLRDVADAHTDEQARELHDRAVGLLADAWDVPPLVTQRGLRPETAAHLLSILSQLQVALFRLRIHLRETEDAARAQKLQDSLDELTLPTGRLAAHVHALTAVYDLLMVRPAYRMLQEWLFGDGVLADMDEDEVEIE
jgi:hypothetical protein